MEENVQEIDLMELFLILKKKIVFIILLAVLFASISGIFTKYFITPEYTTSTTLLMGKEVGSRANEGIELNDLRLAQSLAETYSSLLKSRRILNEVIENLDLNMSTNALRSKISISMKGESASIIYIKVTDTDPERARIIADEVSFVFMRNVAGIMKLENIQLIDNAVLPIYKSSPNTKMNVAIAFILGLMVSVFIVFIIEMLDVRIKSKKDIENLCDLPILGQIPMEDL